MRGGATRCCRPGRRCSRRRCPRTRHGLGPSVVGISPEGEPGARPVPADAAHQVLEEGADLGARRRLARAQENRHRLTALDMVDVDGQEAASVVVGVEQRELLVAVHRIAGVVDVERDRRGRAGEGAAEEIDQRRRHARHLDARGRVLQPLMVGCEHSARPLSGARPTASLNRGSVRRASQSSASFPGSGFAGPRTGCPAGDREHAEAQHRRQRVDHRRRVAPIPHAARQRLGQT